MREALRYVNRWILFLLFSPPVFCNVYSIVFREPHVNKYSDFVDLRFGIYAYVG